MVYHRLVVKTVFQIVLTFLIASCATVNSPLPTIDPRALKPIDAQQIRTPSPDSTSTATPIPTLTPTLTLIPSPTFTLTSEPTLTLTPSATFTATPLPCHEPNGYVVAEQMFSTLLQTKIATRVYLPPCYNDRTQRLPVLYLAHGMFQDESAWTDVGAPLTAANMISDEHLPPFIIVMPSEKDLSTPFGYVLANELVPYIDSHYRTINDRRYRALGGLSRGASWAMFTVLRYPQVFGEMGMHSIGEFNQDDFTAWIKGVPAGYMPKIYIDIGDQDLSRPGSEWMDRTLTQMRVAHEFHLNKGGHDRTYWASYMKDYLRWYTADWEK